MGDIKKISKLIKSSRFRDPIAREGFLEALRIGCRELEYGACPEDVFDMLQQEVAEMYRDIEEPGVVPYIEGYEMGIRALRKLLKTHKQHG